MVRRLFISLLLAAGLSWAQVPGDLLRSGTGADRLTVNTTGEATGRVMAYDGTDSRWEPASLGGTIGCNKNTIGEADLTAAATTEDETLFLAGQHQKLTAIVVKHSTAFTGGGLTGMTVSVGVSGNVTAYSQAFDIFQTAGDTVFQDTNLLKSTTMATGGHSVIARFTSTGGNVSAATAGSVDIWACSVPDLNTLPITFDQIFNVTRTSDTVLTISQGRVRFGNQVYNFPSSATATITAGTGTVRVYVAEDGTLKVGLDGPSVTCAGCTTQASVTSYPTDSIPLFTWVATVSTIWDATGTDVRAFLSTKTIAAGTGIQVTELNGEATIATDATVVLEADIGQGLTTSTGTVLFRYADTLAANPAFNAEECVFSTDGAGGGGILCEGTTGDTNEQLYLFPAVNGADTTDFIVINNTQVTSVDGDGLAIGAGGVLAVLAADSTISVAAGGIDVAPGAIGPNEVSVALKTDQFCYTLFDTATAIPDAADIPSIWMTRARAVTVTEVRCETDAGTPSINLQRDDGTPANILSANLTCTTGGANGTIDTAEDNLAVGNNVDHVTVSGSTAKRINVCVTYTVD